MSVLAVHWHGCSWDFRHGARYPYGREVSQAEYYGAVGTGQAGACLDYDYNHIKYSKLSRCNHSVL